MPSSRQAIVGKSSEPGCRRLYKTPSGKTKCSCSNLSCRRKRVVELEEEKMGVVLQFRSSGACGEGGQSELAPPGLSDLEQLLQTMLAVDGALSEIRSYLLAEDSRRATAGTPDVAGQI